MKDQIALALRVLVLYPAAPVAALLPFVDYDRAAATLTIDLDALSIMIAVAIWGLVAGGTFTWSRVLKRVGGLT